MKHKKLYSLICACSVLLSCCFTFSSGAYANWTPYSANNASQRWYLETVNYRSGDANYNGAMQENDKTIALQYLAGLTTLSNNLQAYLLDANKDNTIDVSDAVLIAQLIAGS